MDFITYFILNKIKEKRKVQLIHLDISKVGFNIEFARIYYKEFDKVFVVSQEIKGKLLNLIPSLNRKIDVFFNIINRD